MDCCSSNEMGQDRRRFLQTSGAALLAAAAGPTLLRAAGDPPAPETTVKQLFDTLTPEQRKKICFAWDHNDGERGLLRTRVANNWQITDEIINTDFYTDDQRDLIRAIYKGILQPDWHAKIDKQLADDGGGYGESQSIAIFGAPGEGAFEFVMTGRHMTLRCDGNSAEHVAFGGPIFYGHAASDFNEPADHPGNVFWRQALEANKLYQMLDGKQRKLALVDKLPAEEKVAFQGREGRFPGIPVGELSSDQQSNLQHVLAVLLEPYRQSDRDEVATCLKAQGGLEGCALAFYREGDIGADETWDCWRLEGPAFVWYFRGAPHVHVWVNVADDSSVKLNA